MKKELLSPRDTYYIARKEPSCVQIGEWKAIIIEFNGTIETSILQLEKNLPT